MLRHLKKVTRADSWWDALDIAMLTATHLANSAALAVVDLAKTVVHNSAT